MIAPYFPSILVPIIGIFLPGIAMAALFIYIEKESIWLGYKDEPNPEYEPKRNKPNIVRTAIPPTKAIAQSGTRLLVSAISFFVNLFNYLIKEVAWK